jgi:multidrug resistance efflux pump
MSEVEVKLKPEIARATGETTWAPHSLTRETQTRRRRVLPVLLTALVVAVAVMLGMAMWDAYMGAPRTRDAVARAYVVTMAPEVAGQIVKLPVREPARPQG